MTEKRWALGIDVGGTRISAGLVSEDGGTRGVSHRDTPRAAGAEAVIDDLLALTARVLKDHDDAIAGIGIGFGGPVDHDRQIVRRSHHVDGWAGVELADIFADKFDLPVELENDANAAGFAEVLFGAAKDHQDVFYVNVGTGVGGALILNGQIRQGVHSNAGEIGHTIVLPEGPVCTCGKRGCVEALSSGDAIARMARQADLTDSRLAKIQASEMSGRRVGEYAVEHGDDLALSIVRRSAHYLGIGIAAVLNLCDPAIVVIGGGVAEMGDLYLNAVRESAKKHAMPAVGRQVSIVPAELGYNAGVVGAGAVALYPKGA